MMTTANSLGVTTFTTPSDREVRAVRVVDAPRTLVWDLWTSPTHLPNWMTGPDGWTMPVCEVDLRPGGEWHFVWRRDNGTEMGMTGTYTEIQPPERLVHTERWGGDWPETINTLILTEENGMTTMTSTVRFPSKADRDRAIGTGMNDGWSRSYDHMDEYLVKVRREK
jgi:uncharacterized protein YndB with AHSA1/START domain